MSPRWILGSGAPAVKFGALALVCALVIAIPLWSRLAGLASDAIAPGIGATIANSDFVNYWMSGRLALSGDLPLLFDFDTYMGLLRSMFGEDYDPHNWSYPPHSILLFLPLGLLDYKPAMAVFLLATLAFHALMAELFRRRIAPDADPALFWGAQIVFVAVNVAATQNGFLTSGLILGFLVFADRRPVLAGLCLALLTIKPQLGLLAPLLLLMARQWATFLWASVLTLALFAASVAAFGFESWTRYVLEVVPFQHVVMTSWEGSMLVMMPTVLSGLRSLGWEAASAMPWQTVFNIACLPLVIAALWRNRDDPAMRASAFALGSFLVAPYSFNYDMGAAVVAMAAFAASARWAGDARPVFALLVCLLPGLVMILGLAGMPIAPAMLVIAFLAIPLRDALKLPVTRQDPAGGVAG